MSTFCVMGLVYNGNFQIAVIQEFLIDSHKPIPGSNRMIATSTTCRLLTHGVLNDRKNIIVMVDEAHRTQEGDLGRKMREALPNAFLFGLTGTPINRADKNTFWAFGADEDTKGYMSRYSFQDSIRDRAT